MLLGLWLVLPGRPFLLSGRGLSFAGLVVVVAGVGFGLLLPAWFVFVAEACGLVLLGGV